MRAESVAPSSREAEAFDRFLDVIAEEVVQRYVAELEESGGKQVGEIPA